MASMDNLPRPPLIPADADGCWLMRSSAPVDAVRATAAAVALVAALGMTALWHVTLGMRVVATEDGRRLQISEHPLALPDAALSPPAGALLANLHGDGRVAIVTFFYSRCTTVCSILGSQYQQMQTALMQRGASGKVRLLSLSFDQRDDTAALVHYAGLQHADNSVWQLAGVPDARQRSALLDAFGIVVLPAPLGEFQHNAAFHVVDRDGRLRRIYDLDQQEAALAYALALAQGARP
jgi:protein SCO1